MHQDDNAPYEFAVHHTEEEGVKTRKMIWAIFWVLLAVTGAEVGLGLTWKDLGISWGFVKSVFIFLTLGKAYFIVAYYMHLKHEWKMLQKVILYPYLAFAAYLIFICLQEASYSYDMSFFMW